jgi:hypothetical protein
MEKMTNKELKELQRMLFRAYALSGSKALKRAEEVISEEVTKRSARRFTY